MKRAFAPGQHCFTAFLHIRGAQMEECGTFHTLDSARAAAQTRLAELTDNERSRSEAWIREFEVLAVDDDGEIEASQSVGGAITI